ncbi:MAG: DUF5683 domain-containing protein [Saprospiraceae bacterium]
MMLVCWTIALSLQAQSADSVPPPPTPLTVESDWPNPKKAVLWGIIPGGGQVYNRDWWKLPIVYGGLGVLTWVFIDNRSEYRRLRDNYALQVDGDPTTNPSESPYNMIDQVSMKQYRDQWRRYTELSGLFLGLGYFFSIGEAFVDAHLGTFDVGDDLSFRPRVVPSAGGIPALGIGMRYSLNRTRPQTVVSPYQPAVLYRASHP